MIIFVKGRFIRYFKMGAKEDENYTPIYLTFYNNKSIISDSKLGLKIKILNEIEKKKEKDEYYKRY
nr:MAG TPA: hypothetical protein [Caudoviricetes sp.]